MATLATSDRGSDRSGRRSTRPWIWAAYKAPRSMSHLQNRTSANHRMCAGHLDLRAQAEVPSALKSDTPQDFQGALPGSWQRPRLGDQGPRIRPAPIRPAVSSACRNRPWRPHVLTFVLHGRTAAPTWSPSCPSKIFDHDREGRRPGRTRCPQDRLARQDEQGSKPPGAPATTRRRQRAKAPLPGPTGVRVSATSITSRGAWRPPLRHVRDHRRRCSCWTSSRLSMSHARESRKCGGVGNRRRTRRPRNRRCTLPPLLSAARLPGACHPCLTRRGRPLARGR
jgi:hypothetical protein